MPQISSRSTRGLIRLVATFRHENYSKSGQCRGTLSTEKLATNKYLRRIDIAPLYPKNVWKAEPIIMAPCNSLIVNLNLCKMPHPAKTFRETTTSRRRCCPVGATTTGFFGSQQHCNHRILKHV